MARNDVVNSNGTINWDIVGGFKDSIDGHTAQLADIAIDIKSPKYGAKGDGVTDDSIALQNAINDVANGGVVLVPNGTFLLKNPITYDGKNFTLLIDGTLKDGITSWTDNVSDTTLNGKGLLAFAHGSITIRGKNGAFDGNTGTAAEKNSFLYLFECDGVVIEKASGNNFTKTAVCGVGCTNVLHKDCLYDGGQYTVIWSRGNTYRIDNVVNTNAQINGLIVLDGGVFSSSSVYPVTRPKDVRISKCKAIGTTATNQDAVGITAQNCDDIVVDGCYVDGQSKSTMAYSFANCTGGQVYGNRALNIDNKSLGTATYAGIGMEFDTVQEIEAWGNTFNNVLTAYIVGNAQNCSFEGVLVSGLQGNSDAGYASLFQLINTTNKSQNIKLSGQVSGGSQRTISGNILCDGLFIENLIALNNSEAVALFYGGSITNLVIDGLIAENETAGMFVVNASDNIIQDIKMSNVRAKTVQTANKYFFTGASANGFFVFDDIVMDGFDAGFVGTSQTMKTVDMNHIHFNNVNTLSNITATNKLTNRLIKDGVVQP